MKSGFECRRTCDVCAMRFALVSLFALNFAEKARHNERSGSSLGRGCSRDSRVCFDFLGPRTIVAIVCEASESL